MKSRIMSEGDTVRKFQTHHILLTESKSETEDVAPFCFLTWSVSRYKIEKKFPSNSANKQTNNLLLLLFDVVVDAL